MCVGPACEPACVLPKPSACCTKPALHGCICSLDWCQFTCLGVIAKAPYPVLKSISAMEASTSCVLPTGLRHTLKQSCEQKALGCFGRPNSKHLGHWSLAVFWHLHNTSIFGVPSNRFNTCTWRKKTKLQCPLFITQPSWGYEVPCTCVSRCTFRVCLFVEGHNKLVEKQFVAANELSRRPSREIPSHCAVPVQDPFSCGSSELQPGRYPQS